MDEGGVGVYSLLVVTNQRFQAINFMDGTVEHLALTMQYHIHVAVESLLMTVAPFQSLAITAGYEAS